MADRNGIGGSLVVVVALVACCALPVLIALGAGALATVGGTALRYWPLTSLGIVVIGWAVFKLSRLIRTRNRALHGGDGRER